MTPDRSLTVSPVAAGMLLACLFAAIAIGAGANQIIAGTALTLGAVGFTGTVYRRVYGVAGAGLDVPTLPPLRIPLLVDLPVIGSALFEQPPLTYVAIVAVPVIWWFLFRTRAGLVLRATGESAALSRVAGVSPQLVRTVAVVTGGAFAGLAGATLVLAQVGTFAERITAGRGYVAIAIVVLGRWHPVGVAIAALAFGAATALQFVFQTLGLDPPYQLFLMLPYALTLMALTGAVGRARAPADLARD
jgi:general nucleoside transport system permease protein